MTISFPMVCGEKKKKGNKKKREKQVATIGRLSTVEKKKNENLKKKEEKETQSTVGMTFLLN